MSETTTEPEFTDEEVEAARQFQAGLRDQAEQVLDGAVAHFVDVLDYTKSQALREITLQALVRAITMFNLLDPAVREAMQGLPLISAPQPQDA